MRADTTSLVQAYVAVGSNIEPERNIPRALQFLAEKATIDAVSTFYRTAPVGPSRQPPFLNGVCAVTTELSAQQLKFDVLRGIEDALGRVRTEDKYAPRTIDLDIALFGDLVVDTPNLHIPDPDILTRPFLAAPLLELAPHLKLPSTGEALRDIVQRQNADSMIPDKDFTEELKARIH